MNLLGMLQKRVEEGPFDTAVLDGVVSFSYARLENDAKKTANSLRYDGGKPVLIYAPNSYEWSVAFFACMIIGRPSFCLGINPTRDEIVSFMLKCGADTILCDGQNYSTIVQIVNDINVDFDCELYINTPIIVISDPDERKRKRFYSTIPMQEAVCYHITSGSSGVSKMVERLHEDMAYEGVGVANALNLKKEDKLLLTTPTYHSFCSGLFIAAIYVGASVVFLPKMDASELEHVIDIQQPTIVAGVPYVFRMMQRFSGRGFEKIRACIAGGAPLSKEIVHYFKAKFNILVCQEYGLSEAGILTINLDPLRFPTSVGQAIPGVILTITDAGQIIAERLHAPNRFIGDSGENVFLGSGKVLTGDLGRLAVQNFLYLEGREKFIINVAGNKVAPREVEDVLNTIPYVMDSFVFPMNEGSEDEYVGAVVLVTDSVNPDVISIKKHCLVRLTIWKIPRRIEIVREIPTTSTGKPDLKAIRQLLGRR